jgi:hypothetical protein
MRAKVRPAVRPISKSVSQRDKNRLAIDLYVTGLGPRRSKGAAVRSGARSVLVSETPIRDRF